MGFSENAVEPLSNSELLRNILLTKHSNKIMLELFCEELIKRLYREEIWKGEMTEIQMSIILGKLIFLKKLTDKTEDLLYNAACVELQK